MILTMTHVASTFLTIICKDITIWNMDYPSRRFIRWYRSRSFDMNPHPSLDHEYPEGKQEKLMTTLTCLCRLVYSHRARYGLTVLPFSSELGVQATQTLDRGNDDQEADHNTFHRCLFFKFRHHYPNRKPDPYGLSKSCRNLVDVQTVPPQISSLPDATSQTPFFLLSL